MYRQNSHLQLIGKVAGVHGVKGELSVYPLTNSPDRFFDLTQVFIATEDPAGGPPQPQVIEGTRVHKGRVLLKLEKIDDRNAAERLVGHEVFILAEEAAELSENEYRLDDLVGLTAEGPDGKRVGKVTRVDDIPGNVLLTISVSPGREVMVPFRKHFVSSVDLGLSRLVLTEAWTGLLDPVEVG
jgi:16S rRNA processing protein RimM